MLALMVGMLRLGLGLFKLGAIVNLLSSPVIVGFTNAAALIIGLSQLSKIIGGDQTIEFSCVANLNLRIQLRDFVGDAGIVDKL